MNKWLMRLGFIAEVLGIIFLIFAGMFTFVVFLFRLVEVVLKVNGLI